MGDLYWVLGRSVKIGLFVLEGLIQRTLLLPVFPWLPENTRREQFPLPIWRLRLVLKSPLLLCSWLAAGQELLCGPCWSSVLGLRVCTTAQPILILPPSAGIISMWHHTQLPSVAYDSQTLYVTYVLVLCAFLLPNSL